MRLELSSEWLWSYRRSISDSSDSYEGMTITLPKLQAMLLTIYAVPIQQCAQVQAYMRKLVHRHCLHSWKLGEP